MGERAPVYSKVEYNAEFDDRFIVLKRAENRFRITDRFTGVYAYVTEKDIKPVLDEVRIVLKCQISHDRFREERWAHNPRIACLVQSFIVPSDTFPLVVRTGNSMLNRTLWWDYFICKYKDYETYKSVAEVEKETMAEVQKLKRETCRAKRKAFRLRKDGDSL